MNEISNDIMIKESEIINNVDISSEEKSISDITTDIKKIDSVKSIEEPRRNSGINLPPLPNAAPPNLPESARIESSSNTTDSSTKPTKKKKKYGMKKKKKDGDISKLP